MNNKYEEGKRCIKNQTAFERYEKTRYKSYKKKGETSSFRKENIADRFSVMEHIIILNN